ncbi:thermonuclease family protein [Cytobacillus oceanisediminis]|uniref:thermonuclease family protein n=1 Tax=Cytobacillus oceanisediminis TaxID=665099 RepID=UPI001FB1CE84|nr:thermonuclease family protein [Cytobacillus oceanisediminis]UOE58096.1 thermonuclease family protein [Cytobacillus oceanisediminis]
MFELYEYKATALKITDGDTYTLKVDCGFRIFPEMEMRLLGIDTPEVKKYAGRYIYEEEIEIGKQIALWVSNRILNQPLMIKTQLDKEDPYGRLLADVYYQENGIWVNLTERMLELGFDKKTIQEKLASSTTIEIPA